MMILDTGLLFWATLYMSRFGWITQHCVPPMVWVMRAETIFSTRVKLGQKASFIM